MRIRYIYSKEFVTFAFETLAYDDFKTAFVVFAP